VGSNHDLVKKDRSIKKIEDKSRSWLEFPCIPDAYIVFVGINWIVGNQRVLYFPLCLCGAY
jgi:hypothetical protein